MYEDMMNRLKNTGIEQLAKHKLLPMKVAGFYNISIHFSREQRTHLFKGLFIAGEHTYCASPTHISAARRLLAIALLDDPANAFFALLYHTLFASDLSRFGHYPKYRSFIKILNDEPSLWERYVARGDDVMLLEVPFSEFRVGSQSFVQTWWHVLLVIRDWRLWRKFCLPCQKAESCYL
ncbi:Glycosyl transferase [Cinnamomum micranthum f. kanehirae]|uniref:Glycosyl transferase n=1 Tax=Cinnamomum micranthum f. kanehirae TaxID=337451 RepID=A0A3S3NV06_9MAGN|nr:Glycosyl transferase [Cinnamomum micranthum f. kanehirae]